MDLGQKESLCEDSSDTKKCCSLCKTSKTPLWRVGPAGPKSLCNACGIKYRKRRTMMGMNKGSEKKKVRAHTATTATATSASVGRGLSESLKMGLMALGKEVVLLQRQRSSTVRRQRRKMMGEEEQAAVLLMALSCGSVFA
ncbi:hypothetical protein L1049_020213 [Liquidambar formosana]|uniref:GATA-type domain-containing protein n=1 Tax=Liquidambar formosana TaxID=63359 RepID=A0AAP0SDN3_LIQFO